MKKKTRIVAHTPHGTFYGNWSDDTEETVEEYQEFIQKNSSNLKYLTLNSGSGTKYIIMKQTLQNSVIEFEQKLLEA